MYSKVYPYDVTSLLGVAVVTVRATEIWSKVHVALLTTRKVVRGETHMKPSTRECSEVLFFFPLLCLYETL